MPGEFPRGWTLNSFQIAGGVATITAAAIPGVVHVLDSLYARITNLGTFGAIFQAVLSVTTATGVVLQTTLIVPLNAAASDSVTLTGLEISSSVGGTIAVAFSAGSGSAALVEEITIQGHDI